MSTFTTHLFARPSFTEGVARLFDWTGELNEYNSSATPEEADAEALRADWMATGEDIAAAIAAERIRLSGAGCVQAK
ncbi:MAG: hypothetical protein ACRC7O_10530 [Fimbriiglobus sp.]